MKEEIKWIDWAKFLGIFLVILGHVLQRVPGWNDCEIINLWDWIYLFHMPLFFVLSGYLYKQSSNPGYRKIFYALIIPYLLYQLLYMPLWNWKALYAEEGATLFFGKHILGILMGDGYETPYSLYSCLPCWFIVSIIQLRLIFYFIKINRTSTLILMAGSVLFLYLRKSLGFDLYCCLDSTIMAIPYYLAGYWLKVTDGFGKLKPLLLGGVKIHYPIV